jgi:nitrilase
MQSNPTIAIIQEAPVFLNLDASLNKALNHIRAAAEAGANIVAFAECWLPGYPVWLDFAPGAALWDEKGAKALFRLLFENSVVVGGPHLGALQKIADELDIYIVMGTHERGGNTLYNTSFSVSPNGGSPVPHRKLVPTYTERLVWGRGDGSTLVAVDTPWGPLGNLICWEHWMPLARAAMHSKQEAVHIAQWPTVRDMHQVASRHYAFEGRCAVAAAGSYMQKSDVIEGFLSLGTDEPEALAMLEAMPGDADSLIHKGGSAIVAADGSYITEPLFNAPGTIFGTVDIADQKEQAQTLDTNGHYSRPDVFELSVNTAPQPGVTFKDG